MKILICGGSKSGKSDFSERVSHTLSKGKNLKYLATMKPFGEEDIKRIENHIEKRKKYGFKTVEKGKNLNEVLDCFEKNDTVLLDSITSLLTNEMFKEKEVIKDPKEKILKEIETLGHRVLNLIVVSDNVFNDSIIYDEYTEKFRENLGIINTKIAKNFDVVVENLYGENRIIYKGREKLKDEELI